MLHVAHIYHMLMYLTSISHAHVPHIYTTCLHRISSFQLLHREPFAFGLVPFSPTPPYEPYKKSFSLRKAGGKRKEGGGRRREEDEEQGAGSREGETGMSDMMTINDDDMK